MCKYTHSYTIHTYTSMGKGYTYINIHKHVYLLTYITTKINTNIYTYIIYKPKHIYIYTYVVNTYYQG